MPIQPIFGLIRGRVTGDGLRPAGQHQYVADVQTPEGKVEDQIVGHSVGNFWPDPLLVRPLPIGRMIFGLRILNVHQWHYTETPDFGVCTTTGAAASRSGGMIPMLLATASREDIIMLKKALASVQ